MAVVDRECWVDKGRPVMPEITMVFSYYASHSMTCRTLPNIQLLVEVHCLGGGHRERLRGARPRASGLRRPDNNTPTARSGMSIYRIYAGADGESHMEEVHVALHAELGALRHVAQ